MPRRDDEFDDDRPRRRPRDDDDDDRPRRRSRDDDDDDRVPPPRRKSNLGLILGIVFGVLLLVCGGGIVGIYYAFKGAVGKVTDAAERMHSTNNLKQINLGVMNYQVQHNDFPNNSYGPDGKPLLSWRVHILPYIEEENLYRQFKLDEPWDSPNNRRLLDEMPMTYASPAERMGKSIKGNKTYYRGFSNPGAMFARRDQPAGPAPKVAKGGKGAKGGLEQGPNIGLDQPLNQRRLVITDIKDGTSQTILVVEAGDPVEWTKPDDLDASPGKPFPALGGIRPKDDTIQVVFVNGDVKIVKRSVSEAQWRAAISYAGNETVNLD